MPGESSLAQAKAVGLLVAGTPSVLVCLAATKKIYFAFAVSEGVINDGGQNLRTGAKRGTGRVKSLEIAVNGIALC